MNDHWSDKEVELIVTDYFSMLTEELRGLKYNKAEHRRSVMPLLDDRKDSSVEFKHQNISAVLAEMGLPFIEGYKPRYNFQKSKLISAVDQYVRNHAGLELLFREFSERIAQESKSIDFSSWVVTPPEVKKKQQEIRLTRKPLQINYLQREQDNRSLGFKGEQLVFEYERHTLLDSRKSFLADKVEWVSRDRGDGYGYDILSKNANGTDKYIEVKTTKLSRETPFYFSSNEYNFSLEQGPNYHLYRIFDFNKSPKMFILNGSFNSFCKMEPTAYIGKF